jgi:hypothetical protein
MVIVALQDQMRGLASLSLARTVYGTTHAVPIFKQLVTECSAGGEHDGVDEEAWER